VTGALIGAGFAVVIGFFGVLCAFLHSLRRILARTAGRIGAVSATTSQIRYHCATISPAIRSMNLNLYGVAANLAEVGDLSESLTPRSPS
jgi:hypothetical protein